MQQSFGSSSGAGACRYVIDRNGMAFAYILDYLRGELTSIPHTGRERSQLLADAEYYQVRLMSADLNSEGQHPDA